MTNAPDPNQPGPAPVPSSTQPSTNPAQKSPLDILEEILQQKDGAGGTAEPVVAQPAVDPAAQEAAQLAEIKALEQQHLVQDQAELAVRQAELATATQSTAYQARVQQDQASQQESKAHATASEGYDIQQLQHTKIQEVITEP
jgi:hypothetical protein